VRQRRLAARCSQLDLAFGVGVSPRHLSFVELGKSRPSPELLLALAEHLEVPLRERNEWLLAAGYAPRYPHSGLDAPVLARVRAGLQRILDAHDPFPGVVVDRCWDIRMSNAAARQLSAEFPGHVTGPSPNLLRMALHPDGFAGRSRNFAQWSPYLLRNLDRALARDDSPALRQLAAEAAGWPGLPSRRNWSAPAGQEITEAVLTWQVTAGGHELSFFTIMSTPGTPLDVTLAELSVELFFPADAATEERLRAAVGR
jgi:transcriptional regulator with XRE-family HTH domain